MTHSRELAAAVCVVADVMFEPLYTADEMRAAEAGHDVEALMERAGRAVAEEVLGAIPDARRIAGVCGERRERRRRTHRAPRCCAEAGRDAEESERASTAPTS